MDRREGAVFEAAPVFRGYLCPPWNRAFEIGSCFPFRAVGDREAGTGVD
jgi:hypothetical protein